MTTPRRLAGMSMVELMVAMAIALIGTIIIFQVFEVSEGIKRTTTSGGDAQQNGAIGLFVIERDLRNAGMGFNDTSYAGCMVNAFDSTRAPNAFQFRMAPVQITGGGGPRDPDSVAIFYGSQYTVASSTYLTAPMGSAVANLKVNPAGRYGFRLGDLLIVTQSIAPVTCELMEVTSLPGADDVGHAATPYTLDWVTSGPVGVTSRFNPPAGSHQFLGTGASAPRVFNIGNPYDSNGAYNLSGPTTPVYNTYTVTNGSLMVASQFAAAAPIPIADNIVHMRALYGLDDGVNNNTITTNASYLAGDGIVDRYVDATTFNGIAPAPWQYLAMVKVVLVARSANAEKPSGGGACDTTTAAPTWSGTPLGAGPFNFQTALDLSADANWQCYRYRVFETTVPLRNWLWKSS